METAGVGGALTGKGADLLIVDDPIKNAEQANSATYREKMWDWWLSTAYTRLEPDGVALLIQTRWSIDDLAGRILANPVEGDQWEVLNLPAIAEPGDALGRKEGEALWPERWPIKRLEAIRRRQEGSFWWSALYQQRPTPAEGGLFKRAWFKSYDWQGDYLKRDGHPPLLRHDRTAWEIFLVVDLAYSTKTRNDYTVISVWGATRTGDLILLDLARDRLEFPQALPLIRQRKTAWRAAYVAMEANGPQKGLADVVAASGIDVVQVETGDKVARASAAAPKVEAGKVWLPLRAAWLEDFVAEVTQFPAAAHDDQVDCLCYAVERARAKEEQGETFAPFSMGR